MEGHSRAWKGNEVLDGNWITFFFFHVIRVDRVGLQEGFGSAEEGEEL